MDGSGEITTQVTNAIVAEGPSCWGLPLTDLKEKQAEDAELSVILDQVADAVEPGEGVLFLARPAANNSHTLMKYFTGIETTMTRRISSPAQD